jgi:hypothetical protein
LCVSRGCGSHPVAAAGFRGIEGPVGALEERIRIGVEDAIGESDRDGDRAARSLLIKRKCLGFDDTARVRSNERI